MSELPIHLRPSVGRRAMLLALGLYAVTGCAATPGAPEQVVRERAQQRWDALIRGDTAAAWRMHAPAWRAMNPLGSWQARLAPNIQWRAAQVGTVLCEFEPAKRCVARVLVRYRFLGFAGPAPELERELVEVWVDADGEWWHLPPS